MKKIKPEFMIADEYLDLRTLDTNVLVEHLEEQIKLREMPLQQKKLLRK